MGLFIDRYSRKRLFEKGIFESYIPLASVDYQSWQSGDDTNDTQSSSLYEDSKTRKVFSLSIFHLIIVVSMSIFAFRLVQLQISHGQENYLLAEGNRLREELQVAQRGLIFDRKGVPLVTNIPSFSIELRLADLPTKKQTDPTRQEVIQQIAEAIEVSAFQLSEMISSARDRDTITLAERLTREQALKYELRLQNISGVTLAKNPVREYAPIIGLGHLLGYTGKITKEERQDRPDLLPSGYLGKSGLEKVYDRKLQGYPGIETVEVDSLNRVIRTVGNAPARPGSSLILGLDAELQTVVGRSLLETLEKYQAKSAAAVVMDVHSGEIRAMVSLPTYDNNIFSFSSLSKEREAILNDPTSPMLNRAIAGQYPSGSTIKPIVAASALQENVITSKTKLDTSKGKIEIGQWTFVDWKVHGVTDVKQAISESNNIFFYALGGGYERITGLGIDRLTKYYSKFGFGEKTSIDLSSETAGLVPNPEWKKKVKKESWYVGDTYNVAIGQGDLLVTPLQLTRAIATIANGGMLIKPRLGHSILSSNGSSEELIPTHIEDKSVISGDNLKYVREGMRQAVISGSARSLSLLSVQVAAKTGTAQFDLSKEKTHSWFTAFAPYENPEIAISVIVEGGGEGYLVAAPVARNAIEQYFNLPITPVISVPITD